MQLCYKMDFCLPKQSWKSRIILNDGSGFQGCFERIVLRRIWIFIIVLRWMRIFSSVLWWIWIFKIIWENPNPSIRWIWISQDCFEMDLDFQDWFGNLDFQNCFKIDLDFQDCFKMDLDFQGCFQMDLDFQACFEIDLNFQDCFEIDLDFRIVLRWTWIFRIV